VPTFVHCTILLDISLGFSDLVTCMLLDLLHAIHVELWLLGSGYRLILLM
jgi:hypothetical protein